MSNKDLVDPVLEGIVIDAANSLTINTEDTPSTVTHTTPTPVTMSTEATAATMSEDDIIIQQLQEEKRELQSQIEEIQEKKEISTEKQIYLRNLRAKKLEITRELRIILEKENEEKYEKAYKRKIEEERSKATEEVNTIFGETSDIMKPSKEAEPAFVRDFNMFGKYNQNQNKKNL